MVRASAMAFGLFEPALQLAKLRPRDVDRRRALCATHRGLCIECRKERLGGS
jgi:hypothetical protein